MSQLDFAVPVEDRCFEDYVPGIEAVYGSIPVTEDEIVAFAKRYDPQPMHTDPAWAATGPFGGLISSGWLTTSLATRLYIDHYLSPTASLASPGVDQIRWLQPVRPGDALSIRVKILEARRSRSKPDRGLVRTEVQVLNQTGAVVLTMTAMNLIRCRDAGDATEDRQRQGASA